MDSCGSPERAPRRIRHTHFGPYLEFISTQFNHILNDFVPTTNFTLVSDGMMCAVLVSAIMREVRGEHSAPLHPAYYILLNKEVDTDRLIIQSFAIPLYPTPLAQVQRYDAAITQYWKDLCEHENRRPEPLLKFRLPRTSQSPVTEEFLDINVSEPTSFPFQPFTSFFCRGGLHGQEFHIPMSAVFFASSLHRLRQHSRQAQLVVHDPYKYQKEKTKIYVLLCSILLYFVNISDDTTAEILGFTRREWRETFEIADRYREEVFGNFGYRQNRFFLQDHRAKLTEWSGEAAEWWAPGEQGRSARIHLQDAFGKLQVALYHVFDVDGQAPGSISHSRSHSHSLPHQVGLFHRPAKVFIPQSRRI